MSSGVGYVFFVIFEVVPLQTHSHILFSICLACHLKDLWLKQLLWRESGKIEEKN